MSSILVVDDVADIRLLCRIVLESGGHQVSEAETGEGALATLQPSPGSAMPDCVLLDINLPGIDGWEVLRQIHERPDLGPVKVIAFSAHASPAEERKAAQEGASGFLRKPFTPDDLLAVFGAG